METNNTEQLLSELHRRFKSNAEIISDPYFIDFVKSNISELVKERNNRKEPKQGFRYKRDWYDRLKDIGDFNADYFLENIGDIWDGISPMSSQNRSVIESVCNRALRQTLKVYSTETNSESNPK